MPLLRHSVTTVIRDAPDHAGDSSCLLIRRRLPDGAAGSRLALHGHFDAAARPRLAGALAGLPADGGPLTVDLTHAVSLDRDTLHLLLGAHAPGRAVVFRVAPHGAVRRLIARLGLQARMGLTGTASRERSTGPPRLPALPARTPPPAPAPGEAAALLFSTATGVI